MGGVSETPETPKVLFRTNFGDIVIALFPDRSPVTVNNFVQYINSGFYDGTLFHRVIDGFVIQGGGFASGLWEKTSNDPIKNESPNGLSNTEMTVSAAYSLQDPDSASSQFFINLADNSEYLDKEENDPDQRGCCVFGEIVEGQDVVLMIGKTPTEERCGMKDIPVHEVLVESASLVDEDAEEDEAPPAAAASAA